MSKKLVKVLSSLMLGAAVGASCAAISVSAYVGDSNCGYYGYYDYDAVYVSDANTFATAISSAKNGSKIVLENNIYLDRSVDIKASAVIDLNGYNIELKNKAVINVGAKLFDHVEKYNVEHPGYYTKDKVVSYVKNPDMAIYDAYGNFLYYEKVPDTEVVTYQDVWHPGWTEIKSKNIYSYLDEIDVLIKNGNIKGARGANGADGIEDTFGYCNGQFGSDGYDTIDVISGTVRIRNASVVGGDGGNGGDGKYQAILHIPFFTGNGGKGGRGGDAGCAVVLERSGAHVVEEEGASLQCGQPGNGGKGGPANEHHWVGSGTPGKDGNAGSKVKAVWKK